MANDVIGIKVLVDAAAAVSALDKTQKAAKTATDAFEKLSDAEKKAVVEMARLQQTARAQADEEARLSRYVAEASKLRQEETKKFNDAAREASAQTAKFAQESQRLARESDSLAKSIESTRIETEKLARANDDHVDALHKSSSKLGLLTADIGGLGDKLKEVSPLWGSMAVSATGAFARISIGVVGALGALGSLTMALANQAASADRNERAARLLGDAYGAVTDATMGTVAATDALRLQQSLVQSGLDVSAQQLGVITRAARDYALATGTETTQAMDQLADALRGMEAEGLRRFNLTVAQSGSRTRDFASAVDQLAQRQANTTTQSRTMAEEVDATTRALSRMVGGIAGAIAKATELADIFRFVSDLFDDQARQRNIQGDAALMRAADRARERGLARTAVDNLARSGHATEAQVEGLRRAMGVRGIGVEQFNRIRAFSENAYNASGDVGQRMIGELMGSLQPLIDRQAQADHAENVRGVMAADAERKVRKLGDAADSAASSLNRVQRALALSLAGRAGITAPNADEFSDMLGQLAAPGGDEVLAQENERQKSEAAFAEDRAGVARDNARRNRIANRDRETRIQSVSRGRSVGAGVLRGLGVSADAMETEAKLTQGYADTIVGAYGKIGDAITRHIELVASGQETIGQAMLNGVHEVAKALAIEAFPRALMELGAGLAALTNPVTAPTAPLHFAAAGVFGAVAAGGGLVAGVTGALGAGQTTGGGAAGARAIGAGRAASGASPRPTQEQAAPVTIYLNSTVPPGPRELQGLVQATAQAGRYNLDRRRDMVPRAVRA